MLEQFNPLQGQVVKSIHPIKAVQFQGLRSKYSHTIILSWLLAFVYDEYPCIVVGYVEWNTASLTVAAYRVVIVLIMYTHEDHRPSSHLSRILDPRIE